jgi:pimeloyl-ACP methyl ester carboxylesterase
MDETTTVLVHGVPETAPIWDTLVPLLERERVVRLSPPGFGAPVPTGFTATAEEYRLWLISRLEEFPHPVDIVGHDFGGIHTVNVVMSRPDLVRSWVSDVIGIFDPAYRWHELAQTWQTRGSGEDAIAQMMGVSHDDRTANLVARGLSRDVAHAVAEGMNNTMGDCILRLYRDTAQPAMATLGRNLEKAAARPGLSIFASDDHWVGTDDQRHRTAHRAGARTEVLDGLGHWWFAENPHAGAAALNNFWRDCRAC